MDWISPEIAAQIPVVVLFAGTMAAIVKYFMNFIKERDRLFQGIISDFLDELNDLTKVVAKMSGIEIEQGRARKNKKGV